MTNSVALPYLNGVHRYGTPAQLLADLDQRVIPRRSRGGANSDLITLQMRWRSLRPLNPALADKVIHVVDPDRANQNQIDGDNVVQERRLH
jgi:hypothetical protein